jgi:N-acetylglucosaminyl-diphospho-decaprenol L-rhamnosyltransferase
MSAESQSTTTQPVKTLSIVIVSWNTRDLLDNCLTSVFADFPENEMEVWVVDNASTDGSSEMVKHSFPGVNLIENRRNIGFAQANNQAIRQSKSQYILLLNPDTKILPGALRKMLQYMQASPRVGASGPKILNPDRTLQTSSYPIPTLSREFWRLMHLDKIWPYGVYDMSRWAPKKNRKVDILLGACLLMRKEALDDVGVLSEDYFMYTEEVDICYRLGRKRWEIYWLPEAEIIHYGGQSTSQVSREMFIHLYQSKILFFKKHYGNTSAFLYKLILLFVSLVRLAFTPVALFTSSPRREERLELVHNYRQLVKTLFASQP